MCETLDDTKAEIDVTVVVSSCDLFSATWEPFCHGFQTYWPDCPWPLKFITNYGWPPCGEPMDMGNDDGPDGWSNITKAALQQIETEVVLWIHDDNWLCVPVDTSVVVSLAQLFEHEDLHLIRLSNCYLSTTTGETYPHDERLNILCNDSQQRTSLQPSLWRRETFIELLVDDESPWTWEGKAPHRSEHIDGGFLCCQRGFRPIRFLSHVDPGWRNEAVEKGKWTPSAIRYAEQEGLDVDFSIDPDPDGVRNRKRRK